MSNSKENLDPVEQQFILAINSLKTLRVTPEGTMRIDVSEIRDQVLASREKYKDLVRRSATQ
ncbi:hypothetical protein GT93_06320 [Pseudomonas plecoglossicida]|nr:hypothetical protein GT93_06320 [Pseudomonas plecoglossicida]